MSLPAIWFSVRTTGWSDTLTPQNHWLRVNMYQRRPFIRHFDTFAMVQNLENGARR